MDLDDALSLAPFLGACFAAASSGALFKPGAWYEGLRKPWWRPPNWLFPPAWAALFLMIAISGWLVWRAAGWAGAAMPLGIWVAQLVVNFAWSALFFGLRRMDLALADLILLWLGILATIIAFAPVSQTAALLLLPYLAWVTFAGVLNWKMWQLNRGTVAA